MKPKITRAQLQHHEDVSQHALEKDDIPPINFSLLNDVHLMAREYLSCPSIILSSWDRDFLRSILRFRKLSDKQLYFCNKIFRSYQLPVKPPSRLENNYPQVSCRYCGDVFELLPSKPGLRDVCIHCINDPSSQEYLYVNSSAQIAGNQVV